MSEANGKTRIGNFLIDLNNVIGKGATGNVYKGYNATTFEPVACKAIKMSQVNNEVTQYLLEGEKRAMKVIKSPYVVKTHQILQEQDHCFIVMELCSGGTLKEHIGQKGKMSPNLAIQMFKNIVMGYIAVVDSLFIHRDLKTANIMLRSNGEPVIIDFGYCEMIMGKRPMIQYNVGSPSYMSPQAHSKSRYSQKSDIWSLGIILYEMLTGKTPDQGINIKDFFKNVEAEGKVRLNTEGFTPVCVQLLDFALQVDPDKRATIHKLKYIIDKSLIPQMQSQLKKAHSCNQQNLGSSPSAKTFGFAPMAKFNYGPLGNKNQDKNNLEREKEKKDAISDNLNFLRSSQQFLWQSERVIPSTPSSQSHIPFSFENLADKNQQSLMTFPGQNIPPPSIHPILRKSLERNNVTIQKTMLKKATTFKQSEPRQVLRKTGPLLQKTSSLQDQHIGQQLRGNVISMRII